MSTSTLFNYINNAYPQTRAMKFVESRNLDYGFQVKLFITDEEIVSVLYSPYREAMYWDIVDADEFDDSHLPVIEEDSIYCDGEYYYSCLPLNEAKELMSGDELPFIQLNPVTKEDPIGLSF